MRNLGIEFLQYFGKIIADRRAKPRDDLASVLANAEIDGVRMGDVETLGYYLITFTAGHDTTRNALAGGMLRAGRAPGRAREAPRRPEGPRRRRGRRDRALDDAGELHDADGGARHRARRRRSIRAGERLLLFYASANRDEDVFEAPYSFRIDRHPNPHLGFGIGEHFCLGSHLARKSQRALFAELIGRLEDVELAGPVEKLAASFVAGIKHLPLRYRLAPRA